MNRPGSEQTTQRPQIRILPRRGDTFESIMRRVDQAMCEVESRLNHLLDETACDFRDGPPIFGGWTITPRDGTPIVERFGSFTSSPGQATGGWRRPLMTYVIDEDEGMLQFSTEMPGVSRDEIDVNIHRDRIELGAENDERHYRGRALLEREIDPESAEARYHHGVLHIEAKLATPQRSPARRLVVD